MFGTLEGKFCIRSCLCLVYSGKGKQQFKYQTEGFVKHIDILVIKIVNTNFTKNTQICIARAKNLILKHYHLDRIVMSRNHKNDR